MAVAPEALAALMISLAFLALICANAAYRSTFGLLLDQIVKLLNAVKLPGFLGGVHLLGFAANAVDAANHAILHAIGQGIQATQWAWHKNIRWLTYVFQETAEAIAYTAEETRNALHFLRHYAIPLAVGVALGPTAAIVALLRKQVLALAKDAAHVATSIVHEVPKVIQRVEHVATTVTRTVYVTVPAAVAAAVAIPFPRIGTLEREAQSARSNIAKLRRTLTVSGIAGLVAAAVGALGFGWVRCSRVGRLGKAVCGMNENLLESLLAGALLIASTISIVEFAKSCQAFTDAVETPLRDFVRELRDLNPSKAPDASSQLAAYIAGNF